MPYVYGFGSDAPDGGYNGRGSLASGAQGQGSSYQGAGSFNPMTGAGEGSGFAGRGMLVFTRGIAGGFGGWEGNEYTGPTGETTIDYTYGNGETEPPHAVMSRSNGDTFSYDDNGNMTSRTQDGVTWTQVFDAENRLVSVSNNATPSTATTYIYDGSGGRLKRIVDDGVTTTTTLYVGNMEIQKVGTTETQRTVYYGNAFRIIGGANAGLYFMHGDHLGSVSVISDANGIKVAGSDVVYAPFGEVRAGNESELTDLGYTRQRHDDSTGGLMYYKARYYLPSIQHFISADTIVQGITSQVLNRYSYVLNNPIRYSDPSGHIVCEGATHCGNNNQSTLDRLRTRYRSLTSELRKHDVVLDTSTIENFEVKIKVATTVLTGVKTAANTAAKTINLDERFGNDSPDAPRPVTPVKAFQGVFRPTHIRVEAKQSDVTTVEVGVDPDGNPINWPPYGINCGFGPVTRCTSKMPGYWHIELALNRVLGVGEPEETGVNLVVHEISHTLTHQDYNFAVMKPKIDGFGSLVDYWRENAGVQAASVHSDWEYTADLIASWALNRWKKDNATNNANVASFMACMLTNSCSE